MIATGTLVTLLVQLVVAGLICYLLFWAIGKIGLPEPFAKIATAVIVLVVVVFLLDILLGLGGHPLFK